MSQKRGHIRLILFQAILPKHVVDVQEFNDWPTVQQEILTLIEQLIVHTGIVKIERTWKDVYGRQLWKTTNSQLFTGALKWRKKKSYAERERGREVRRKKWWQKITSNDCRKSKNSVWCEWTPSGSFTKCWKDTNDKMYTQFTSPKHTLPLYPSLTLCPFCLTSPGWLHWLFQDPPMSSHHDLQKHISDQFNVRKYEVGEPQWPSVTGWWVRAITKVGKDYYYYYYYHCCCIKISQENIWHTSQLSGTRRKQVSRHSAQNSILLWSWVTFFWIWYIISTTIWYYIGIICLFFSLCTNHRSEWLLRWLNL